MKTDTVSLNRNLHLHDRAMNGQEVPKNAPGNTHPSHTQNSIVSNFTAHQTALKLETSKVLNLSPAKTMLTQGLKEQSTQV